MTTHLSAWQARQEIYLLADKKGWFVVRPIVIPLIDLSKAINIQFTITRFVKKAISSVSLYKCTNAVDKVQKNFNFFLHSFSPNESIQ